MITENLSTLKIHKLTKEQYDRELAAGRIDPSALYLTPDEDTSGVSSWNDLTDNPFYSKSSIVSWASAGIDVSTVPREIGVSLEPDVGGSGIFVAVYWNWGSGSGISVGAACVLRAGIPGAAGAGITFMMLKGLGMLKGINRRSSTKSHSPYCSRRLIRPFRIKRSTVMIRISTQDVMIHSVMVLRLL